MGKCPFSKNCKLFSEESRTCTKDNGWYYAPGRFAGCGRNFIEKGKKSTYYKKRDKPLTFGEKIKKALGFNIFE